MKFIKIKLLTAVIFILANALLFVGCTSDNTIVTNTDNNKNTGFVVTNPESFDSEDTALVVKIDNENQIITFFNYDVQKKYTLEYDGTSKCFDRYGNAVSLNQIEEGDICDVTFLKTKKHLTSISLSDSAWKNQGVNNFIIDNVKDEITIGSDIYKMNKDIFFFSDGSIVDGEDINKADVLTISGVDKEIYSVSIEKGHGYLRLKNDAAFVGGWIEIGQSIITHITEDMLLTVPEGSYTVNVSNNGNSGSKSVVINRNEETSLDIGDIEVKEVQYGKVIFTLSPEDATLYIDGQKADTTSAISLSFGIHQLICMADGYQTVTKYLNVGEESAGIDITLEEGTDDEESSVSDSDSDSTDTATTAEDEEEDSASDSSNTSNTISSYYKVYIDSPKNVEVYVDGNYVGISPCSFKKVTGSHEITLRKTGYETRSYSVDVDDEEKDYTFSFVDLESKN